MKTFLSAQYLGWLLAAVLASLSTIIVGAEPGTVKDKIPVSYLKLSTQQITLAEIGLDTVDAATIHETLPLYGVIAANADRRQVVSARYPGILRSINKKVGDPVREGETLATVESNESLKTYPLVAALSGVVTERHANTGEQTRDKELFTLADLSSVWVELALFPRDLAKVHVGQQARISQSQTSASTEGEVVYVAATGQDQRVSVRVQINNSGGQWKPGLYVSGAILLSAVPVNLAVRNEALQTLDGNSVVFVRSATGFDVRPVKLGRRDDETSEVLAGLEAGERYATRNSFILKAELEKSETEE